MPTLRFTGQILPRAFAISLSDHPTLYLYERPSTYLGTLNLVVQNNDFTTQFEYLSGPITEERERQAMLRTHDLVGTFISLTSFQTGLGLSFVIERMHYEDGTSHEVGFEEGYLQQFATAVQSAEDLTAVMNIVHNELELSLSLRDLTASIGTLHAAPHNCARAIEAIRHFFVPDGERKQGWRRMGENLNLSETFVRQITDASIGPRHGDRTATVDDFRPLLEASWQVMNRFLEYRKRGNQRLPESEFPLLV